MAGVLTKRKGFSSVLIFSAGGQSQYDKEMAVINCMNIMKYTLIGYISLLNQYYCFITYFTHRITNMAY